MKFIITTIGTAGDVYPFIGIAQELQQRGHTVYFLSAETYRHNVEKHGIYFHAVLSKEQNISALEDPQVNRLLTNITAFSRNFIIPTLKPAYDFIEKQYEKQNTILISHVMFISSRIAHEKLGIPLVTIHLAPIGMLSIHHPLRYPGVTFPPTLPHWMKSSLFYLFLIFLDRMLLLPDINAFRRSLGLSPVKHVFKTWIHSPTKIIALFPKWFGFQPEDWPKQLEVTNFPLYNPNGITEIPSGLREFLDRPHKTIIFTAGTGVRYAHNFFKESMMACEKLGCQGILLTRHKEQIPESLPEFMYHLDYLPLNTLLNHVSAIVHFGGIGTAAQALAHGVPQLVVPNIGDQFDNALRLRQCGVALELRQYQYKFDRIVEKLNELLNSNLIHLNCRKYAALMKQHQGIQQACNIVEKMPELEADEHPEFCYV
ncbi:glycosyltransferase [Candidiatus Paracoxiella cheracis]|uniref:glycosyltransferase n=1 Tax=Candidiatus Paracoxiella cheracis TaxID=3405120 RepID=UPI003BF4F5B4